ncbi:MAG TPA: DinB family protein [Thermoanaerobaculia bacterium]|jgi:uncharacterized damage-inducible protein DinB
MNRFGTLFLILLLPAVALAQTTAAKSPAKPTGFRAEFLANLADTEDKIVSLANSTPAEKFSWRPGSDIRSISEVYMHIAGGNYFLSTFVGADAPKRNGDLEKTVTRKAEVIAELRRSFDHLRAAAMNSGDLEAKVKMFGTTTTRRGVLVTMLNHLHEHLGQSIAYARMNGVAPPWSH